VPCRAAGDYAGEADQGKSPATQEKMSSPMTVVFIEAGRASGDMINGVFGVGSQSSNKAGTSLFEDRVHRGRYTAVDLDNQTNPICEGTPLNEFRDRSGKPSGINEFKLHLGLVARPGAESNLSFAASSGHMQRPSSRGSR
jgi:hypothetical protein